MAATTRGRAGTLGIDQDRGRHAARARCVPRSLSPTARAGDLRHQRPGLFDRRDVDVGRGGTPRPVAPDSSSPRQAPSRARGATMSVALDQPMWLLPRMTLGAPSTMSSPAPPRPARSRHSSGTRDAATEGAEPLPLLRAGVVVGEQRNAVGGGGFARSARSNAAPRCRASAAAAPAPGSPRAKARSAPPSGRSCRGASARCRRRHVIVEGQHMMRRAASHPRSRLRPRD